MAPYLRKVEKEVLIPRYLEYKINHELCREESRLFSLCAKESGFSVITACKELQMQFKECSNRYFNDPEIRNQAEKEYLEKRERFRKTGQAEKSPFKRI